ncbi:MAG: IgGFc-binding protein [Polyangiales bacterium]
MKLRWFTPLVLLVACGEEPRGEVQIPVLDECNGLSDRVLCNAGSALTCRGGVVAERAQCGSQGLTCTVNVGCRACAPNTVSCDGNKRYRCAADGSAKTLVEECPAELQCSLGGCRDLCADAALDRSYLGCDYWPVFTSNSQLARDFKPAVSVGNGNLVPAHVTITRGGLPVAELDVPAQSAQTLELNADEALKEPAGSLLVRGGAYHLVASVPVTVHQFNPLKFELPFDCTDPRDEPDPDAAVRDNKCNSFTADASLLFPSSALAPDVDNGATSVEFYAMSRAMFMGRGEDSNKPWAGLPSFVAISGVGTKRAHVRIESSAFLAASPVGAAEPIAALSPGGVLEVELDPGDVLQLVTQQATCLESDAVVRMVGRASYCDPGPRYDVTGTHIVASGAVQVIAGHDCSNAPFDRVACDHLEESMTPLATWGSSAVLSAPSNSAGGQYLARVLSGADGNLISFEPALREPVTLARGQTLELGAGQSLRVRGKDRILVGQYLVGANGALVGDPSLMLAVPVDQYRQSYNFLSPATYTQNFVDVIALDGDTITIDGNFVSGFTRVGDTRYRTATVALTAAGAHEARGTLGSGFGIVVYGLGSYTSYMLPGGLALKPIVIGY